MKILVVSGWRHWVDSQFIIRHLGNTLGMFNHYRVGCATGVDTITRHWLERNGLPFTFYKAGWDTYGKAAGILRNQDMITGVLDNYIPATDLLAFPKPGSFHDSGTWDCIRRAYAKGIPCTTPIYPMQHQEQETLL